MLSTDHGFEPQYHSLYPARALRDAGLTVTDANGTLDASRTKAFYAGSGVIRVNRRGVYAGGIVGKIPGKRDYTDVIGQVRQALLRVRGVDGERVVKRVVRSKRFRREGVGGPHGGELHIVLYPNRGYYWASDLGPAGAPVIEANTSGGGWHGNRVVGNPSMQGFAVLGGRPVRRRCRHPACPQHRPDPDRRGGGQHHSRRALARPGAQGGARRVADARSVVDRAWRR
ncbi:hypothetical protein BH20ACT7_BH20ACT7_08900 [soil metagenome]